MLENAHLIVYPLLGFGTAYIALEAAWHFTACRIHSTEIKPCIFKQAKMLVNGSRL